MGIIKNSKLGSSDSSMAIKQVKENQKDNCARRTSIWIDQFCYVERNVVYLEPYWGKNDECWDFTEKKNRNDDRCSNIINAYLMETYLISFATFRYPVNPRRTVPMWLMWSLFSSYTITWFYDNLNMFFLADK